MTTFPVAHSIFTDRATKRRVEFRRIKKVYEKFSDVNPEPLIDAKNIQDKNRFIIKNYSDRSLEQPPFLVEPDFYFNKAYHFNIPDEVLENVSDSEQIILQSAEEAKAKMQ